MNLKMSTIIYYIRLFHSIILPNQGSGVSDICEVKGELTASMVSLKLMIESEFVIVSLFECTLSTEVYFLIFYLRMRQTL